METSRGQFAFNSFTRLQESVNFLIFFSSNRISLPPSPKCECNTRAPMINGWEGTAVLTHGSLIRFGCMSYVFSIVLSNVGDEEFYAMK